MAGGESMIAAVDSYLAVRRAAGFTLSNAEYLLRSFASFATNQIPENPLGAFARYRSGGIRPLLGVP
jgi:hypothetical protein